MKILITSPSLDTNKNVSGISSVVNNILSTTELDYTHFEVGKKDNEKRNILWMLKQLLIPIRLLKVFFIKDIDIFHLNAPLNNLSIGRDFVLLCIAKIFRKKVLLHIHGGDYLHSTPKNKVFFLFLKFYFRSADFIITLSHHEKSLMITNYSIVKEKIDFLENCVIPIKEVKKIKKTKPRIIFLGRIVKEKGMREIIASLKELYKKRQDFEFYLYGEGPLVKYMQSELSQLNKSFDFKGIVFGKKKETALLEADIFILPSYAEGLPMALLEAINYENIVIVTKVGTMAKIIKDNINGFLIKEKNAKELFEKIDHAIDLIKNNEKRIQKNAKDLIFNDFNGYKYSEKLKLIYERLN